MNGSARIPKMIHWCWFGDSEPSGAALHSVAHWAELMPEYEILRWDESNFDVGQCAFSRGAYEARKWAFVSDYARFKVVHEFGGVYMDVGSNLLKSIDPLVARGPFTGRESGTRFANPGLVLAAGARQELLDKTLAAYESLEFEDTEAFLHSHTVNAMFVRTLARYGYSNRADELWEGGGFTVYPSEYFSPRLSLGGYRTTADTYATHKGSASWTSPRERYRIEFIGRWAPYVGDFMARKAGRVLSTVKFRKASE